MSNRRLDEDKNWDRQLESGLPDSRLSSMRRENTTTTFRDKHWDYVYCASCSTLQGMCTGLIPHVFFLCDACAAKGYGNAVGAVEIPTEVAVGNTT